MLSAGQLRRWQRSASALVYVLLGVLAACGTPSRPPADTAEIPGYLRLKEQVGDYDFAPLRGRRIVIDPGHGGRFPGAIGPGGLTEASVNLGVALYLRGLLEWAGTEVWLTRTADYDLLTPADSSLAADLAARVALVDSLQPDVFVSIHHNSTASRDPDINETQTYYPVGRNGPDLDLARAIHKHLVRNLEISPAKIMAGNFHVIRHSPVPAVLGEPAMISNPVIEGRLSLARSHELEATAYFLGLREYFAGGMPQLLTATADTIQLESGHSVTWTFAADGGPGLDPQSVRLTVDAIAQPVTVDPDGRTIRWLPRREDLDGWHQVELTAANLAGRTAQPAVITVRGPLNQPWRLDLYYEAETGSVADPPRVLISWQHPQMQRRLPAMRLLVTPDATAAPEQPPADITLPPQPGQRGWLLQPATALPPPHGGALYELSPAAFAPGDSSVSAAVTARPNWHAVPAPWRFAPLHCPRRWWPDSVVPGGAWRARQLPDGAPVDLRDPTAPVLAVLPEEPFWLEAAGALPIIADGAHRTPWPTAGAGPDTSAWEPLAPPVIGKLIVLDPTGGGSITDGTAPLGTRGTDLNLQVARRCARLLEGLGARTVLTREDETWVPAPQKILLANQQDADLFLTIQRSDERTGGIVLRHHHGSRAGSDWAAATAAAAQTLLAPGVTVVTEPSYAYLLRHTACPALEVNLPLPADAMAEERANLPAWQEAQARALALGVVSQFTGASASDGAVDLAAVIAGGGPQMIPLASVAWALFDGNLFWQPLDLAAPTTHSPDTARGAVALSYMETPGLPATGPRHTLEIHAGPNWQLWALTRNSDGTFSYRLLRENR